MSNLAEHIDRLSQLSKSIRSVSASTSRPTYDAEPVGPFTRAVLYTPLGDLIRDIGPAELGLFTLVTPSHPVPSHPAHDVEAAGSSGREIARVEFPGATPLKKPPAPKAGRHDVQRAREHDPEVYAQAALKYLDRYQSIRPMPRASEQVANIIEQLEAVRANMHELNNKLKQHALEGPAEPPLSPNSIIKAEERKIHDAQAHIAELKKRKAVLQKQKATSRPRTQPAVKSRPTPSTPTSPPDIQEETFWNTPGAAARTLHFKGDSLLDEKVDLADVSTMDFVSPAVPRHRAPSRPTSRAAPRPIVREIPVEDNAAPEVPPTLEDEADETVVLKRVPPAPPVAASPITPPIAEETSLPPSLPASPSPPALTEIPSHRTKLKVTTELERAVARIWTTVGELIKPGHPFDVSETSTNKPPRAKETITHLQKLSTSTPAPPSPTASSLSSLTVQASSSSSSQPTAQQILTAHMLLALLSAPPAYAMSLGKLKEVLAEKTKEIGAPETGVTKPIYGCVAKRLLKIDRGGGEQVVKFNM